MKIFIKNQEKGQVVIVLLLVMLVALSVGLVITQRSINDVTTSTQTEQFSRAFSAAEAGIEKVLNQNSTITLSEEQLGNQSSAEAKVTSCLPRSGQALEYPPISKETTAQFWLANPNVSGCTGSAYNGNLVTLYFGNSNLQNNSTEIPAVEVALVRFDGTTYSTQRRYIDPVPSRRNNNGFEPLNCNGNTGAINTTSSTDDLILDRSFKCKVTIDTRGTAPIMLRVRIIYSDISQQVALAPQLGKSLPPQAAYYTSTGTSGLSQKTIQVFKLYYVTPVFFDYSIFATGQVKK